MTLSILLVALSSFIGTAYSQDDSADSGESKFLSIQHAQSGSISEINATAYSLQLNDVSDKTILFADRPNRIVTLISTDNFIGNWSAGDDSFLLDPPNAVLVVDEKEGQDTTIVELFNPIYKIDERTLKYDAIPDNTTSIDLPDKFGQSTLVIDLERHTVTKYPTD
jgi:hypothetical protein